MSNSEVAPVGWEGHWPKSIKYVIWNEFCERFSFYGLKTILALFLWEHLHLSENESTELVHLFIVFSYASPLAGAILSDGYWGKYKTVLSLSIVYCIGNWVLASGALPDTDHGSTSSAFWITSAGLFLIALGTGGIKPCIAAFGGDQIELTMEAGPHKTRLQRQFFSLYYFAVNSGSVISTVLTPVLRANISYAFAFSVPAVLMMVALLIFWAGRKTYAHRPPGGNVLGEVGSVLVDAVKLRSIDEPEYLLAGVEVEGVLVSNDTASVKGRSEKTRAHWLDIAKIKHNSSVVEDVKILLQALIVLLPAPLFWSLSDQQSSKWTFQAQQLDGKISWLGGIVIQPDQMQAFNPVLVLLMIPIFDQVIYPYAERCGFSLKPIRRMILGMALGAVAFLVSAALQVIVELRAADGASGGGENSTLNSFLWLASSTGELSYAQASDNKVSILWQLPQYVLITAGEILFSITGLEFAYSQAPDSMKSVVQAMWLFTVAAGNLVTIIIVAVIGDSLSKANEFLFFAGCILLAIFMMIWLSNGFVYIDDKVDKPQEEHAHLVESAEVHLG